MDERKKIIIDTDNGDDIDDLIALYFALHLKEKFEIVGIICSFLNTPLRKKQVELALKLHQISGIPVFAGCRKPLLGMHNTDINQSYCQYFDFLGSGEKDEEEEAVDFLISKARELKNKLTIVEVAPQLTLAKAIKKDKNAFKDTPIVMMAANFNQNEREWNIECDAISSQVVLESGLNLTYVGHDITIQTTLEDPDVEGVLLQKYDDERRNFLSMSANAWVKASQRHIVLHDPLALLTVVDKDLCTFERKHISMYIEGNKAFTVVDNKSPYVANVATSVDLKKLYNYLFDLMKGEN